jgi:hypothetical protein
MISCHVGRLSQVDLHFPVMLQQWRIGILQQPDRKCINFSVPAHVTSVVPAAS